MAKQLISFFNDRSGATSIEYGLIAVIVSIAAIGALSLIGAPLDTMYSSVSNVVTGAADTVGGS